MFLPSCLQLFSLIRSPLACDIRQTVTQNYMIRPVNVKRMLEILRKPEDRSFVIRTENDAYIPENNGTWEVRGSRAERTDLSPDLTVSIQAFGQLAAGSVSLAEAMYRPDVTVHGRGDVLAGIFVRKPILVEDHF